MKSFLSCSSSFVVAFALSALTGCSTPVEETGHAEEALHTGPRKAILVCTSRAAGAPTYRIDSLIDGPNAAIVKLGPDANPVAEVTFPEADLVQLGGVFAWSTNWDRSGHAAFYYHADSKTFLLDIQRFMDAFQMNTPGPVTGYTCALP